ncbi:ABC transporter permease [Pseudoflavonifractor sp. 524-17]|uniref:ABC transporter permease n=1 Tax=Pseudoflavonifractor sp. 524-17 TaxID=2304577 RepID=UPI001379693E|nr:ABC transporter permease [Pseudoflavonifractor sp. 524-17]NCE64712.1 ABC transporter permease [Pseudoflavonifractor sp. 524-17]
MLKYILKRLISLLPVIIGATLIVYLILNMAQGDPARIILGENATPEAIAQLREEMGLNDPVLVRYGRYMLNLVHGDMGTSYRTNAPVSDEIFARLPYTLWLAAASIIICILLALPLGTIAAIKQNSFLDGLCMVLSLLGVSMPSFWLGLLLILLFSLTLGWLPPFGADEWKSVILPAFALAVSSMASVARTTRASMLEVIRQDYIRTARSKGISQGRVIRRHALRNAMIPTMTSIGIQVGFLLSGSVLVETVFSWPGIGRLMITSIQQRDIPTVLGCIIIFAIFFSIVNLIVDLLYGFIDPRMKSQYA